MSQPQDRFHFAQPIRSVAVIGAGASGLPCVRHLRDAGLEVRVFERQNQAGGIWNWSSRVGRPLAVPTPPPSRAAFTPKRPFVEEERSRRLITDNVALEMELANPSNPVYWSLNNNVPTTTMAFKDFPYSAGTPENIRHEQIASYMQAYAKHIGLEDVVHFNTRVERAEKVEDRWRLVLRKITSAARGLEEEVWSETFDALVVATGHYNAPFIPPVTGLAAWATAFPDRVLHTQNYRSPASYQGGHVLIVGTGTSAIDIARDMAPHVSKLYFSARDLAAAPQGYLQMRTGQRRWLPAGSRVVAPIKRFFRPAAGSSAAETAIELENGEILTGITHLLFATGYIYSYPFFPHLHCDPGTEAQVGWDRLLITTGDSVQNLYRDVFYIPDPSLAFLGLSVNTSAFSFFEYQSISIARVFSQKAWLPSTDVMRSTLATQAQEYGMSSKFLHFLGKELERRYVRQTVEWMNDDAHISGATPITGHSPEWLAASDRISELIAARMKPVTVGEALGETQHEKVDVERQNVALTTVTLGVDRELILA